MTNEEKAREIAKENCSEFFCDNRQYIDSEDDCYDSAMEMAKWKDECLKEYINNLSKKYSDEATAAFNNHDVLQNEFLNGKVNVLNHIMNELFKKDEATLKSKTEDLCMKCEHKRSDFPMPQRVYIPHCEIADKKIGFKSIDDIVPYPCTECPFKSYKEKINK